MKFLNTTSILIWLILVAATSTLFAIFVPADGGSAVFWTNLFWLIAMETLAVGSISVVSRKQFFSTQNVALAMQICRAAAIGVLVFALGNAIIALGAEPRWYYVALVLFSAYFSVKILFLSQGANAQTVTQSSHEKRIEVKNTKTRSFPSLVPAYQTALFGKENLSAEKKQSTERAIAAFADEATCIPASEFLSDSRLAATLDAEIENVRNAIAALEHADAGTEPDALAELEFTARRAAGEIASIRK